MALFHNRYRVESTRLASWDYSRGWYFVTICTENKKCILGHAVNGRVMLSNAGLIAEAEKKAVSSHYSNVIIDRYVVMPNHVHSIVVIEGNHVYSPVETRLHCFPLARLPNIVGGYKAGVSRICHARGLLGFAWQARFHDHILRSNISVNSVRDYIDHNPQNWLRDPDNPAAALSCKKMFRRNGLAPSQLRAELHFEALGGSAAA
jgi:putative transposase